MYKNILLLIFGSVCVAAIITVLQIWGPLMDWEVYFKVIITMGIFVVLAAFGLIVRGELDQHKKLKDQDYVD